MWEALILLAKCDDWKWREVVDKRDRWFAAIGWRRKCGAPI